MTSAILREAAALMRTRAEAAIDLRWDHIGGGRVAGWLDGYGEAGVCDALRKSDADHIASWHPAVALAVANWLEATAREFDALNDPDLTGHPLDGRRTAGLAVAVAYLGGEPS